MILRYALGHYPLPSLASQTETHLKESNKGHQQWVQTIDEIKKQWNQYSQGNKGSDMAPLTFYFSFLTIMNFPSAKHILEVGCGTGKLIPLAIMLKKQQATYLATDLAENMIESAKNNLKQNFLKYNSKLTFEEWCLEQNLEFKVANGEQIIDKKIKFDRIICNCVLMITQDPIKMLKAFFDQAQSGCLLGVSVWGDRNKNPMLKFITQVLSNENKDHPLRQEFHLYKKVGQLAQKIGWKLLLQWQQNSIVPIVNLDSKQNDFGKTLKFFTNHLPQNKRFSARQKIIQKARTLIKNKEGLNFSTEMYLFQKPY